MIFPGQLLRTAGKTLPSLTFMESLKHRAQQIFSMELWHSGCNQVEYWLLRSRDVLWFIDNEAAAAATIRGASCEPDVELIVQVAHLLCLHLGCTVWLEWIDGHSNPADG